MFRAIKTILLMTSAGMLMQATPLILFSGNGINGTSGNESWVLNFDNGTVTGTDDWGMPGVGNGDETWSLSNPLVDEFNLTFTIPAGISIASATLVDSTDGGVWSSNITNMGNSVTLFAPIGQPLNPGDSFFLNVFFTSPYDSFPNGIAWSGDATTTPEPVTLSLVGAGLLGIGFLGRRARKSRP